MSETGTLYVWIPDDESEPEDPNRHGLPKDAAIDYASDRFYEGDYPAVQIVHVRDASGAVTRWAVEARQEVSFYATSADAMGIA